MLAYRNRAAAYAAKKVLALAVLDYDEAIKLGPPDAQAFGGRATALFELGKYDGCHRRSDRAAAPQPAQ